eukprot:g32927.t2
MVRPILQRWLRHLFRVRLHRGTLLPCHSRSSVALAAAGGLGAGVGVAWTWRPVMMEGQAAPPDITIERSVEMVNWSGTQGQLQRLIRWASQAKQKVRPVGMNLSPNGLALQEGGMLSMTELDGIKGIDKEKNTITVQAGARVSQILAELQKHNLTLENFSSITETQKSPGQLHAGTELQQIAGWTQVSAHGTGARIPPVDEMITSMTVVSPAKGLMTLREGDSWFPWMRVALGSLAVVQEMTLKVRPRYMLHERTYCCNYAELERDHAKLLQTYRHVRYMWVPYTDTIVVVVSDIAKPGAKAVPALPEERRGKNFAELREKLLVLDPLNPDHVAKVNRAEAEFWRKSSGERIADSTEVLGFECGGSQWVLENCFPCGTIDSPNLKDIKYVQEMKGIIERERIAAASPIEQRWTSRTFSSHVQWDSWLCFSEEKHGKRIH